ncbi:hypothetical protein J2W70_003770 [Pseudomonas koreensis]|jgi:hypothetical protein|uniref:hypothetical protein n=1 Tax=Pseudomonas koreensis TaxID=198620 RepID=UPI002865F0F4|nr:hypothetical protein [Pseudomonas koreensis]MDR7056389.1 hypothetical protein [Pseudomonas koreensis]
MYHLGSNQKELDMTTYTLSHVSIESIKDDVEQLSGNSYLWRVECEGEVIAYCIEKAFADRITDLPYIRAVRPTGTLFAFPSTDAPVAICVGAINELLRQSK